MGSKGSANIITNIMITIPPNILVACASAPRVDRQGTVYNTLPLWIESVDRLHLPTYVFLNDYPNDYPEISTLKQSLSNYDIIYEETILNFKYDNRTVETRIPSPEQAYIRFVLTRNKILNYALDHGYKYLLSIDSDVLVPPDIVQHLLNIYNNNFTVPYGYIISPAIVSVVVNNSIRDNKEYPDSIYNFGVKDTYRPMSGQEWQYDNIINTTYAGACSLIDLDFIHKYNIRYSTGLDGEDWEFCKQIRDAGGHIVVSTSKKHEAFHIQEPHLYDKAKEYMAQTASQLPSSKNVPSTPTQWGTPLVHPNQLGEPKYRLGPDDIPYSQIAKYFNVPVKYLKNIAENCPITPDVFYNLWISGNL